MSTLFKRIVVLSVLASVSCYYVNAVGVSARPAPVVMSAPTIRSTPIKSTPVKSTPSKSNSVKTTKSTTSESETRSVTNNYYYNNGGFFNSVVGAFTGTWLYHSLFDDNNTTKETDTEDTNDSNSVEDETFSISYWITNNLEYVKNLLFGIK